MRVGITMFREITEEKDAGKALLLLLRRLST
jgi:hypothetical protein